MSTDVSTGVRADGVTAAAAPGAAAGRLRLDHLDTLESEAIHIFREVAAEFERPVLLFSGGKDSVVMLHLAAKAFWPAPVPFTLLHVDTGHNFPEVLDYRDRTVARLGARLEVAHVQDYIDDGRLNERTDGTRNPLQTQPLLDAIVDHSFDAVFGGARRDEEKARAKERIFSLRDEFGAWDPRNQRPELWNLYNGKHRPVSTCGSSRCRTGPSWTCGATSSASRSSCPSSTTPTIARCSSATGCGWPSGRGPSRASTSPW